MKPAVSAGALIIVASALTANVSFAQTQSPPAAPAAPAPAVDPARVKEAEALLLASAKAYAEAAAFTDAIIIETKGEAMAEKQEMSVEVQGETARLKFSSLTITAIKPAVFVTKEGVDERYVEWAYEGQLDQALIDNLGFAPPQLIARQSKDPSALLAAFTFQMLPNPTIAGHSMKTEGGAEMHEIALTSPIGDGAILIDPKTRLVKQARIHAVPAGAPAGFELNAVISYAPKLVAKIEPAIAFDAASRTKVSSMEELRIDLTGKPAPDFTLEALDGTSVTLSDLKGSVVVLDFWATWCGPCIKGLPLLQEFATWAKDNNQPVKVFAVDVWERTKPEATRIAVAKFWKDKGFTMPTLLDLDGAAAKKYGFDSIPTTVIIDPKGNVLEVHTGSGPGMVDQLKKNVEQALAQ